MFDGLHLPATAIAIEDEGGTHTWEHIHKAVAIRSAQLRSNHAPKDRVALLADPAAGWLIELISIWRADCIAVPLNPRHPAKLRASLLADARASSATSGDVAMLLYTSGTTGEPKGAMLTHSNIAANNEAIVEAWGLARRSSLLHCLPLHHMHGIGIALLPCLAAGMRCVMLPRFSATMVWDRLPEVDTFMAVPTMYHRLLAAYDEADTPTQARWEQSARALELATSGSSALPRSLADRWAGITGEIPLERWGMTEVGVGLSNPLDPAGRRRGWVGQPIGALQTRVTGDGELLVRGPSVCSGYWNKPNATAASFSGGWFHTGDIVTRDPANGFRIEGRRSVDIIKSGGYKLSALAIEECFRDHDAIEDIAVVGLPDEAYGEIVAAAVVTRAPCNNDDLTAWARERLAAYQVPRVFRFVSALPRNAVGKVQKPRVRELFE